MFTVKTALLGAIAAPIISTLSGLPMVPPAQLNHGCQLVQVQYLDDAGQMQDASFKTWECSK